MKINCTNCNTKGNNLSVVILNYRDYISTISLIKKIMEYDVINKIVVVDGKSENESIEKLSALESEKIHVIEAPMNGGYGYGNNIGIRYSKQIGMNYVLIANPDVYFEEESIETCLKILQSKPNCAAVSPRASSGSIAIKFAPLYKDILCASLVLNKVFKPRDYDNDYFNEKTWCYVDALPGSLVMFDIDKFIKCGLYDENVFLYHEEIIVGKKLYNAGYKSVLALDTEYNHEHSISVSKVHGISIIPSKIGNKSHRYYLKEYCGGNKFTLALFDFISNVSIVEKIIWLRIKWMINYIRGTNFHGEK